jgi:hypothetical protein
MGEILSQEKEGRKQRRKIRREGGKREGGKEHGGKEEGRKERKKKRKGRWSSHYLMQIERY